MIGSDSSPRSVVSVGGLARNDTGNFAAEFEAIVVQLAAVLDGARQPAASSAAEKIGAGKD